MAAPGSTHDSPYATTALVCLAVVSVFWCVEALVFVVFGWRLHLTGLSYAVGPITIPREHWPLLVRALTQAGLVGGCLGLWWLADRRGERWSDVRDHAAAWGATPGLALPAGVLLTLVVRMASNQVFPLIG
ncbi:MAG: hypothetical protein AAGA57_10565 [Planctomycetota bacterium]